MSTLGHNTTISWLGHATFHIVSPGGKKLLIDAWVDTNPACPDSWKQRIREEGVDYILVTHGHGDHISDLLSLATLSDAKIVCQFDIVPWLTAKGVNEAQIIGFNKGGTIDLDGIKVTMTHAVHSSTTVENDMPVVMGTEAGYVVTFENGFVAYITGDTAVTYDMQIIGDLYKPELTILPIGDHFTMGPRQAAYALKLIGSRYAIPSHYATFPLLSGTPEKLREHLAEFGISTEIIAPNVGESVA